MTQLTETPNPDATVPTGMCGSPKVCAQCPSHFLCAIKAGKERELIKVRRANETPASSEEERADA